MAKWLIYNFGRIFIYFVYIIFNEKKSSELEELLNKCNEIFTTFFLINNDLFKNKDEN